MSMRELFCPDPLAGVEKKKKMAGLQIFFLPNKRNFPLIPWKGQAICL